ncbi:hypothetical protein T08_1054 [Trichinella sp. T8]|nr:hypothetical protein T08_1054 [Trichinella sp. T8]
MSLFKSCTRLFQHDIGKLPLAREHNFIQPPLILSEWHTDLYRCTYFMSLRK